MVSLEAGRSEIWLDARNSIATKVPITPSWRWRHYKKSCRWRRKNSGSRWDQMLWGRRHLFQLDTVKDEGHRSSLGVAKWQNKTAGIHIILGCWSPLWLFIICLAKMQSEFFGIWSRLVQKSHMACLAHRTQGTLQRAYLQSEISSQDVQGSEILAGVRPAVISTLTLIEL